MVSIGLEKQENLGTALGALKHRAWSSGHTLSNLLSSLLKHTWLEAVLCWYRSSVKICQVFSCEWLRVHGGVNELEIPLLTFDVLASTHAHR